MLFELEKLTPPDGLNIRCNALRLLTPYPAYFYFCARPSIRNLSPELKPRSASPMPLLSSKLRITSLLLTAHGKDKNGIEFDDVTVQSQIAV